jgi:transposase
MITVQHREKIRRAYYWDGKSMRQIAREMKHGYWTIRKALDSAEHEPYTLVEGKPAPVLGPFKGEIDRLLAEEAEMPRKQRYTSKQICKIIRKQGYQGSESGLRRYVGRQRQALKRPKIFLPLEFDPGIDAQVDWGEVWIVLAGERIRVQLFVLRLCYSRKVFAMAFPTQRQEAFFAAHAEAFKHLEGVPHRLSYDNLTTAVKRVLEGKNREEQSAFVAFRSHYLFDSRFCTPNQGHEKGGVEHGVGYIRRNFLVPLPEVDSFAELNAALLAACIEDEQRRVDRQKQTIGEAWQVEKGYLHSLPAREFACCVSREVRLNPYGQVVFETNRYSVPAEKARPQLTLKAYPFHIEVMADNQLIAVHERCYERQQDILDPLHYLSLLAERPGAFEHAKPLRQWRATWPPLYEQLLAALRAHHRQPQSPSGPHESRAIQEFIQVLQLHRDHSAARVERAIEQALADGVPHREGVAFCLNRLLDETPQLAPLDLSDRPELVGVGRQPVGVAHYNELLEVVS